MKNSLNKLFKKYNDKDKNTFWILGLIVGLLAAISVFYRLFSEGLKSFDYNSFTHSMGGFFQMYIIFKFSLWAFFSNEETSYRRGIKLFEERLEQLEKENKELRNKFETKE